MKKQGILNSEIASILAKLGHTDTIVIADAGLPIPDEVKRIDIALEKGVPSFLQTLDAILADMEVESVTLANEIKDLNENLEKEMINRFSGKEMTYVSHESFKNMTKQAKAVIRTGEMAPFANIILHAGVLF